uniref:C2H2-type domain-containing protein n=1 Tax=Amblyomma triste TaxID=251400 RepID=A0A023G541_AMBTT
MKEKTESQHAQRPEELLLHRWRVAVRRDGQPKLFTSQKLLTQHFIKVHAEKKYSCSKCSKRFGAEWLSKHHEATCGTSWCCSCGASYQNREALLTHARRRSHTLPFELKRGDACKRKQASNQSLQPIIVPVATQVIIVIQSPKEKSSDSKDTLSQNPTKAPSQWRSIIPKANLKGDSSSCGLDTTSGVLSVGKVHQGSQTNVSCKCRHTKDSCIQACSVKGSTKDASELVNLPLKACKRSRAMKTAVHTQTCESDVHHASIQPLSSKAMSKKARHRCSIQTQTIESAVGRAQKARAKRLIVSPEPRKLDKEIATSELWSDLDQILFNNCATPSKEWMDIFSRSSSATQTLDTDALLKDLCNSYPSSRSLFLDGPRESFSQIGLPAVPLEQGLDVISPKPGMLPVLAPICEPGVTGSLEDSLHDVGHILSSETQTDDLFDSLLIENMQQTAAQTDFPACSHNETQTNEDVSFESTDVLHMETQTSGILFCDFESVDIETQTPWDHLDFSLDDLVVESDFTMKKDAESQIGNYQLVCPWHCLKSDVLNSKGWNNMQTQTSGLL